MLLGGALLLGLLVVLAPLLLAAALLLLVIAWRSPQVVQRALDHPMAGRIPGQVRASPMRLASLVLAATLPLAAVNYAIAGGRTDAPASPSAPVAVGTTGPTGPRATEPATQRTATPRPTTPPSTASPSPSSASPASVVPSATPRPVVHVPDGELVVYFLDVGQGDATLLMAPDATMLIDTGPHDGNTVVPALRSLGVTSLDVIAITHGHADHIGQLDRVLGNFDVGEVWMSGTPHTTQTFQRAIAALEASTAGYEEPRAGDTTSVGSLGIEILSPATLVGDLHADMLTMRVTYGDVSFLFSGDAEANLEGQLVDRFGNGLRSTVYHVGHHGSQASNSARFLAAVQPEVAVYSASSDNQYGHPHPEALQRLQAVGADIYGTAVNGRVTITTDGRTFRVATASTIATFVPPIPTPAVSTPAPQPPPAAASGCAAGQVNINAAGVDQLLLIIHIGPERASQILSLRPFSSVDDMLRISGIGPARLADIKAEGIACVP